VTLKKNGAAQSVTRTIRNTDGGIATVTVSPINIDQVPPVVRVTGAKNGATYNAPGPARLVCVASDSLSGLAGPCVLTVKRTASRLSWTATAEDKAGNVTAVKGSAVILDYFVAKAPYRKGYFHVKAGHSYLVKAYVSTTKAPHYVYPVPQGSKPYRVGAALTKAGPDLWAIQITISSGMTDPPYWVLGVKVGRKVHTIAIDVSS
jgi:hypothetical protein